MARQMKDSGVEWIGAIPFTWEIRKVKSILNLQTGFTPETQNDDYYSDDGVDWVTIGDLNANKYIPPETKKKISKTYIELFSPEITPAGSLLYSFKLSVGQTAFTDRPVYTNEAIVSFLESECYSMEFLRFASFLIKYNANTNIYGARILNQDLIKNALLVVPSHDEQNIIASFLNLKSSQIDILIQNVQSQIEEYKKLKQVIITEAVIKGVRGSRPMKTSGVEWIGEIPEEWEVVRLKTRFSFGKGLPITKADLVPSGSPVVSYGQVHSTNNNGTTLSNDLFRFVDESYLETKPQSLVHFGDFIVADTSEDIEGCGNCVYVDSELVLFAGYHTIILFDKESRDNKYFAYLFQSNEWRNQIRSKVSGVKVFSISRKILSDACCTVPSLSEQQEISSYLDTKCSEIDSIIAKKERLIEELGSYKKSLIYEYVTGKKEVSA